MAFSENLVKAKECSTHTFYKQIQGDSHPLKPSSGPIEVQTPKLLSFHRITTGQAWEGGQGSHPIFNTSIFSLQTEEPGKLQSIGSQRVRQSWSNLACTHTKSFHQSAMLFHKFLMNPFLLSRIVSRNDLWSESHSVISDSWRPHRLYINGILQARILEWVAVPFSRGSSQPRDWTQVSCISDGFFTSWATLRRTNT